MPRLRKPAAGSALADATVPRHDETASPVLGQGAVKQQAAPNRGLARNQGGDLLHLESLHVPVCQGDLGASLRTGKTADNRVRSSNA